VLKGGKGIEEVVDLMMPEEKVGSDVFEFFHDT